MKKSRKIPKCVRPEEWVKLIKVIPKKDKKTKVCFLLAYGSGMRISEVMRCNKSHFRDNGSIFIPESKYGVERVVPIPKGWRDEFFKVLPFWDGKIPVKIEDAYRKFQRKFQKYSKKAELNPIYTFHSLRHGFATRLLESGVPINQVQVLLGHSDVKTTSIYTKASPKDAIKSYEDLF